MRKRLQIALLLLVCVLVGAFLWQRRPESQPVFSGMPLDYWLRQYAKGTSQTPEARRAFRRLGQRAVPRLVQVLQERDPCWEKPYFRIFCYLPATVRKR